MRPLSRLLSVFLALILMGLSVATVAANDPPTTDKASLYATMAVTIVDPPDAIYPGDELTFLVTV